LAPGGVADLVDPHKRCRGGGPACSGAGNTADAIVTVPVHTKTWQDNSLGGACTSNGDCGGSTPFCSGTGFCAHFAGCDGDGVFNGGDAVITEFDQILDFTTSQAHSSWSDIDGDGCSLAGGGPAVGQPSQTGVCINFVNNPDTVTTVAAGGFGSTGVPDDGSFSTKLPNTFTLTGAFAGDTCPSPPAINFAGTATRCIP